MFNYFSISGLCIAVINLGLVFLITFFSKKKLHKIWAYVNYAISAFGLGIFISGSTTKYEVAFVGWKVFTIGITLIAVFITMLFFYFVILNLIDF